MRSESICWSGFHSITLALSLHSSLPSFREEISGAQLHNFPPHEVRLISSLLPFQLYDIMFDTNRPEMQPSNNFCLSNGNFCSQQSQQYGVNYTNSATFAQGQTGSYGDFYQQNTTNDGMILIASNNQSADVDQSAMPYCSSGVTQNHPYPNGECQYDPNSLAPVDHQSQFHGQNNFDYCSYYPSGPYDQSALKPLMGSLNDSHYGGHHYPNGTFMPPYHSSPTSSSYTSTGSDESDDMVSCSHLHCQSFGRKNVKHHACVSVWLSVQDLSNFRRIRRQREKVETGEEAKAQERS